MINVKIYLNKNEQILLDWINTIDEPQCLLVSEIGQLYDCSVFLEIMKNFLKRFNKEIYIHRKG